MLPILVLREALYKLALTDSGFFRRFARPYLYHAAGGDPERAHDLGIAYLRDYETVVEEVAEKFEFPELQVEVAGRQRIPFGTAAGFDKNGEVLCPLSHIFGFEEPGTVVLEPREGNPKPRVAVDDSKHEIYNAQGFPSLGMRRFVSNIREYKRKGGKAPLFVSICGIPPSPDQVAIAYEEMESLVEAISPYSDGLVWNPYSPNTEALKALRTEETFGRVAKVLKSRVGTKPILVKLGPYADNPSERSEWLRLVSAWIEGGADGVVVVNTLMVPKDQVPSEKWGYSSAGRSGPILKEYRNRAIGDVRREFPDALVIATGGIDSGAGALEAFAAGADLLEGYTAYTFSGFGLLIDIARDMKKLLRKLGYGGLSGFINDIRPS